jgi:hypothetical protein
VVPAEAPTAEQSLAANSVYGQSPTGGLDVARQVQDSGVAQPQDQPQAEARLVFSGEAFDAAKLTLPEGAEFDPAIMKQFGEVVRDQASAQRLVDMHLQASRGYWDTQQTQWEDAAQADPEIGGRTSRPSSTAPKVCSAITSLWIVCPSRTRKLSGNSPTCARRRYGLHCERDNRTGKERGIRDYSRSDGTWP